MASVPNYPLFKTIIQELPSHARYKSVLYATGPSFLSAMLAKFYETQPPNTIAVYHKRFLTPADYKYRGKDPGEKAIIKRYPDAYMLQLYDANWH